MAAYDYKAGKCGDPSSHRRWRKAGPDRAKMERRQETCPDGHKPGAPCKRNPTDEGIT